MAVRTDTFGVARLPSAAIRQRQKEYLPPMPCLAASKPINAKQHRIPTKAALLQRCFTVGISYELNLGERGLSCCDQTADLPGYTCELCCAVHCDQKSHFFSSCVLCFGLRPEVTYLSSCCAVVCTKVVCLASVVVRGRVQASAGAAVSGAPLGRVGWSQAVGRTDTK